MTVQRSLNGICWEPATEGAVMDLGRGGEMRITHLSALGIPMPPRTPIFSSGRGETPLWPGGGLLSWIRKPSWRESRHKGPALRHRLVVYAGPPPQRTGECATSLDPWPVKKVKIAAIPAPQKFAHGYKGWRPRRAVKMDAGSGTLGTEIQGLQSAFSSRN